MRRRPLCLGLCAAVLLAPVGLAAQEISGWREAVLSVRNLDRWAATLAAVGRWEVAWRGAADPRLADAWRLPESARIDEMLLRNPGTDRGFVRLVRITGVPQQPIRSNGQTWETGGIFDLNVRVTDVAARFAELQARDWQGYADPIRFTFGPFVVREWLGRGPDGIVFALIQREQPPLEGWPLIRGFSRSFNSTQIVSDLDASLDFYVGLLGFEVYVETEGPSPAPGPNVLGLPYELAAEISRHTVIVDPAGRNEGSVELIEFDGISGRDFAERARPPNLGVLALRFPVDDLPALAKRLADRNWPLEARSRLALPPYGEVELLALRGPNGEWLEFFEAAGGD